MTKYYDTTIAAEFLGLSPRTLERWRLDGKGPIFRKLGSRVMYAESDLIDWSDAQRRIPTSDPGE